MSVVRASYQSYYPPAPAPWGTWNTTGYVHAPDYPGALADGSSLTIASNTTYSFYSFPATSTVVVPANAVNVTFHGCQFLATGGVGSTACNMSNGGNNNITFDYCTFAPPGVTEPGPPGGVPIATSYQYAIFAGSTGKLTVTNCDCWGFGNGFIYASGSTLANPHLYDFNYVHDICQDSTYHSDGIGLPGGDTASYVTITRNNIQCAGNTQALAYQNSPGPSNWDHFTITGNIFGGYGYTINVINGTSGSPSAPTNITFTGNTFSTGTQCLIGPIYDNTFISKPNWIWRRNKWLVPPGNPYWGHAQYSGYYWLPGFTSSAGPSLDELSAGLVGTSDYTG